MKRFTVRGWIHSKDGDDKEFEMQIDAKEVKNVHAMTQAWLNRQHSTVLTDYTII